MKILQKSLSLVLTLLIALQSLQITIFANESIIDDILDGNYDYVISDDQYTDDVYVANQDYDFETDYSAPFAHLLESQVSNDPVTRIMNLLDVDQTSAMQMITVFGDAESALAEAVEYDSLRRTYYTLNYNKDYLTNLVIQGYGAQRVAMSYIVSDILDADITDVMVTDYPTDEIDEYAQILVYYYYMSYDFIEEYLTANNIDSFILYSVIQATFEEMFPNASIFSTFSAEDAEDEEIPEAPFYSQSGENEYVSPGNGALTYMLDLASLPGVNGTDINLSLEYDSSKAGLYGKANVTGTGGGGPVYDSNGNEIGGYGYSTTSTTYDDYDWANRSPYVFGSGWRLNYDYISVENGTTYLNLSEGSRYRVTHTSNEYMLSGYNRNSLSLAPDEGTYIGSEYKLTFADGTVEYFDTDGNLLAKIDRFGNAITFTYSDISIPVDIEGSTDTYTKRFTITNSSGTITVDNGLLNTRITLPDGNIARLTYSNQGGGYHLTSFTDYEGKVTSFTYLVQESGIKGYTYTTAERDNNNVVRYMMTYTYSYERIPHYFLSTITYPTSATTSYTYETHSRAKVDEVAVTSRRDNDGVSDKNVINYTYLMTSVPELYYTDRVYRMQTADYGEYLVEYEFTDGFATKETTKIGDVIKGWVERIYSTSVGKPVSITRTEADPIYGTVVGTGTWVGQGVSGTYPIYDLTSYISNTSTYTYDSKGYVLTSTENGLTKTYTYDSTYHLPLTVVYNQNSSTQIREAYTLSADKKTATAKNIYVNNALSAKYSYSYLSNGCLASESAYKATNDYIETRYTYDAAGRVASRIVPKEMWPTEDDITQSYTYDAMGRVLSETDGNGNTTFYEYDSMGRVTEVKHPDDSDFDRSHITTSYTVSSTENRITEIDEVGNVTTYNYDAIGNIVSVYVGNTLVERYEYDEYSRVSRKTDSYGNSTVYTYDYAGRTASTSVYAQGTTVPTYQESYTYEVIADDGLLKTTKTVVGDANSPSVVTVTYTDPYGRIIKEGFILNSVEHLSYYTYDNLGNRISELSAQDAQNGYTYTNQYVYDYAGRVTQTTNALGEHNYTAYDWLGNAVSKTDNAGNTTTFTYDDFGRLSTQTTPFDATTSTKLTYTYDKVGNVLSETTESVSLGGTALLSKTEYVYDCRNNLAAVKSYISESEYLTTATYTYDKKCQMLTSTAGTYTTAYAYDAYGNVNRITYPGGGYETFTYLPNGNLLSSTDRSGVTTTYTYNALGSPILVTAGGSTLTYTYTATGALRTESNGTATAAYTYDALGRVATETSNGVTTAYAYDLNGNVTALTVGNHVVAYTYDRLNRMTSATEGNVTTTYGYDTNGNRTSTTTLVGGVTATQTVYTYNLAHLATSLVNYNGAGAILSSFAYTYSADGNILSEVDHTGAFTNYSYDMLGRLVSEVGNSGSRFYTYDVAGNRTQAIIDTITTVSYTYNSDGSLASELSNNGSISETTTYTYDLNGNLVSKSKGLSVTLYTYDVWGNMTSGAGATYAYNAQGLRTSKTVSGSTDSFVLVGGDVWSDGSTNYLRGIELISNGTQLYLYNIRGDVIQLVDYNGNVTKTYDYDAYGNELTRDLADENPFRYCGEYYDVETGFIYLRARYYDPMVGRFTTVDPIKSGLNWYSYCGEDPVNYIDPSGMSFVFGAIAFAAAISLLHLGQYALVETNYKNNKTLEDNQEATYNSYDATDFIYGQKNYKYIGYKYGFGGGGYNTCEVIALHNVKVYLGMESTLSQTIYDMQMNGGMWLYGILGSFPSYVNVMLQEYDIGFTDIFGTDEMTMDGMYIVSYWNKNKEDIFYGIHTIAIENKNGKYYGYNVYSGSSGVETLTQDELDEISLYFLSGCYITNS